MKESRILIGCTTSDKSWLKNIQKWESKGLLEDANIIPQALDSRFHSKAEVKAHLLDRIEEMDICVLLLGDTRLPELWLEAIVELCRRLKVRLICLRIPQTKIPKPETLKSYVELVFNPNAILSQIRRARHNRENDIINETDLFQDHGDTKAFFG